MNNIGILPPKLMKKGLNEKLLRICEVNNICFMAMFGSFVNGRENKRSDIDIAIEFMKNTNKDLFDLVHIEDDLRKMFGRKVDLGIFSAINPYIKNDVKKQMLVIYEKR
jgi:predicted nucleotidyltransferase